MICGEEQFLWGDTEEAFRTNAAYLPKSLYLSLFFTFNYHIFVFYLYYFLSVCYTVSDGNQ